MTVPVPTAPRRCAHIAGLLSGVLLAVGAVALSGLSGADAAGHIPTQRPGPGGVRTISFSGFDWVVKDSTDPVGPGPNYFSSSPQNVWVDGRGRLHLRIRKAGDRWLCSEVFATQSLGYGTYRWTLSSRVDLVDPNVVVGLFTWSDDPAYFHREIDVEFARWAEPFGLNAQYAVQPYVKPGNVHPFDMSLSAPTSSHGFDWETSAIDFRSARGTDPGNLIQRWSYTGSDIPVPGTEVPHINLWLFQAAPPTDGRDVELIVAGFVSYPRPVRGASAGRSRGRGGSRSSRPLRPRSSPCPPPG